VSGITPILDTLLHQVLGKRVDVPVIRDLPSPVRPLQPGQALQAVHSDSRLDPRPTPTGDSARGAPTSERPAAPPPLPAAPPAGGSTRTHFSAAARTIGDLLSQYPAPPSAVRPAAPLLPAGETGAVRVAADLRGSLEQSGLFYESHLQGWFRGERSLEQLAREPQMRLFREALGPTAGAEPPARPQAPARTGTAAAAPAGQPDTRPAAPAAAPSVASSPAAAATTSPAGAGNVESGADPEARVAAESAPAGRVPFSEGQSEALHGVLRHQLEMLATPVLRWEGDVWSGLFMALVMQIPPRDPQGREQPQGEQRQQRDDAAPAWRSELTLRLATLGDVRVRLTLAGQRVDLELSAAETTARRLRAGGSRLRERLEQVVRDPVSVTVHEVREHE
tara:strand:- start:16429 stop:17607 length:1179 start_codon:yes stop_codon:yes gene_type:complete